MSEHNETMYRALAKGPATAAQVAKKTHMTTEEAQEVLDNWHTGLLWVDVNTEGKTAKYTLTDVGRNLNAAAYDNTGSTPGGSTDGSIKVGQTYNRPDGEGKSRNAPGT